MIEGYTGGWGKGEQGKGKGKTGRENGARGKVFFTLQL
jgi:hypothetical protein